MHQNVCVKGDKERERYRKCSHVHKGLRRENWRSPDYNMFHSTCQEWLQTNGKKISLTYVVIAD